MQSRRGQLFFHSGPIGLLAVAISIAAPAAFGRGATQPEVKLDIAAWLAAAHLPEPLIRTSRTSQSEDRALLRALAVYERRSTPDDFTSLIGFLKGHPHSPWRVSLWTDLGLSYLHYGYYSKALDALGRAWKEGKNADGLGSKAEVDRAIGELVLLHARLGHADQAAALLKEVGDRPLSGPATTTIQLARENLWVMRNDPRHMWLCGPLALRFLMLADKVPPKKVDFLQWYHATPRGVSLAELEQLSDKAGEPYVAVYRSPDQPVPVPSLVHWKAGHYAAIVAVRNGSYRVFDPVLGTGDHWITAGAIKAEASGYFLVRADQAKSSGWRKVAGAEADRVWGAGPAMTEGNNPNGTPANPTGGCSNGMTSYNVSEVAVGVTLTDSPCGYTPPKGPPVQVTISYSQWEASQPAVFSFFNIGQKWTFNFLTYVQDDPNAAGSNVILYRPTGGDSPESGYTDNGAFAADELDESILVLSSQSPVVYTRNLRDGTVETYSESDGASSYPRHVFLSTITDPQGNMLTLNYQTVSNQIHLASLTDATGRQTTFTYGNTSFPLQITQITDPFGRSATLNYDSLGRLISITDVLGLTSTYTYDVNSLVNSLTTPYGTTTFNYGTNDGGRWVQVTDPLGNNEREETFEGFPAPVPSTEPPNTIPRGILNPFDEYLEFRDSFHWDKHAYVVAGCTLTGNLPSTCNYGDARVTHFTHYANNTGIMWEATESRKYPLENRIWQNLPGQNSNPNCPLGTACSGTYDQPSAVGQVTSFGNVAAEYGYNGAGNLTLYVDPAGRTTNFVYAANNVDLVAVDQVTPQNNAQLAAYTYNNQHRPLTYTDAAGQVTSYTYNSAGQVTQIALPLNRVYSFAYDAYGRLTTVTNPNNVTAMGYTYDGYDRIATAIDSEGYTVSYSYDAADRLTQITYPDGTKRTYTYQNLDLVSATDRLGHTTTYTYDANRDLLSILNAAGGLTQYSHFENGALKSLTDPNGNTTSWSIDVESRLTQKQYANGSQETFTYDPDSSLLTAVTDALGQTKQYSYTVDSRLKSISYLNAQQPTPSVFFTYDPYFPRLQEARYVPASDSLNLAYGTQYTYVPVGSPGALRIQQDSEFLSPDNSFTVSYQYDAAGRVTARTIGSTQETFGYDNLDRPISDTNPLGTFDISYLGQTNQPVSRQLAGTSDQIAWSYLPNSGDRRLAGINNYAIRQYQFATTPEALISAITQQPSGGSQTTWNFTYDAGNRLTNATASSGLQYGFMLDNAGNIQSMQTTSGTTTWSYNDVNELVNSSAGVTYSYDLDGERFSDGSARSYTWDAESRLVGVAVSAGGSSQYSYDAFGRRVAITTSAGMTQFLWCGAQICQSSDADGNVLRQYYAEGEYIPSSGTMLYYGRDQLGSVRDVAVVAPHQGITTQAYDYDPYGNLMSPPGTLPIKRLVPPRAAMVGEVLQASAAPLQPLSLHGANASKIAQQPTTGATPDFLYTGMYYDSASGLYLTQYRAYDPTTARWLSRDPLGEMNDLGPRSVWPETPNPALETLPPLPPVDTFTPTLIVMPGLSASTPAVPNLALYNPAATDRSNLYLYVSDNPLLFVDRLGLCNPFIHYAAAAFGVAAAVATAELGPVGAAVVAVDASDAAEAALNAAANGFPAPPGYVYPADFSGLNNYPSPPDVYNPNGGMLNPFAYSPQNTPP